LGAAATLVSDSRIEPALSEMTPEDELLLVAADELVVGAPPVEDELLAFVELVAPPVPLTPPVP
jgi:hypothetical protein